MIQAVCGVLPILGMFLSVSRKDDPNKIGFPGGKVDPGETHEEALIRETFEETGLHVRVVEVDPYVANIDDYSVSCYIIELEDRDHEMSEETGIVRLATSLQLIKASPYAAYNIEVFKWFGDKI